MFKKILYSLALLLFLFITFFWWYLSEVHAFRIDRSLFQAVPATSSVFFHVRDKNILSGQVFGSHNVDSLINYFNIKDQPLNEHNFMMIAHTVSSDKFDWVYAFKKDDNDLKKLFDGIESRFFNNIKGACAYQGFAINKIAELNLFYTDIDGLVLITRNKYLMEVFIDHVLAFEDIRNRPSFNEIYLLTKKSKRSVVYIDHENISYIDKIFLSESGHSILNKTLSGTSWTALDINKKNDHVSLNGFINYKKRNSDNKESVLSHQRAREFTLFNVFSDNIIFYFLLSISNDNKLFSNSSNPYLNYFINECFEGELALLGVPGKPKSHFISLKIDENVFNENAQSFGFNLYDSILDPKIYISDTIINNMISLMDISIPGMDLRKLPYRFYSSIYKDAMLISNNSENLKKYIERLKTGNLLTKNIDYIKFSDKYISSESNCLFFYNATNDESLKRELTNIRPKALGGLLSSENRFYMLELNNYKDKIYANFIYTIKDKEYESERISRKDIVWDTTIISTPTFVENHNTHKYELIFQDALLNLNLTDISGTLIWKAGIKEKIKSQIKQIDIYGNKKLQYIFNTDNYIYIIDRNGNLIEGFPIKLKETATNEVFYVDYENNFKYRFFIACKNGVYGFNRKGELLKGWAPLKDVGQVKFPIKHMSLNNKDFIIIANDKGELFLKNRKGKDKIKKQSFKTEFLNEFKADFSQYPYNLVNADSSMNIIRLDIPVRNNMNANVSKEKLKPIEYFDFKVFDFVDIDGDNKRDYLFMNGNQINALNNKNEFILSYTFPETMKPSIKKIIYRSDLKYMAFLSDKTNRLYLLDKSGNLVDGFPIDGSRFIDYCLVKNTLYMSSMGADNHIYLYTL